MERTRISGVPQVRPQVTGRRQDSPIGRDYLDACLRRRGLVAIAKPVFLRYPTLRPLLERIAYYLTDRVPHASGVPLLDVMIGNGFAYFEQKTTWKLSLSGQEQLLDLVAGVFTAFPAIVEVEVKASNGSLWDPLKGEALGAWLRGRPQIDVRLMDELSASIATKAPRSIRIALLNAVVLPADIQALPRGGLDVVVDYPLR